MGSHWLKKKNNRNSTGANQARAVDKINRNKMAAAIRKVWREQKHILIKAKFSRINGSNKYILLSQSTTNWKFGQHKSGLTKPLKATNRGFSYATVQKQYLDSQTPECKRPKTSVSLTSTRSVKFCMCIINK